LLILTDGKNKIAWQGCAFRWSSPASEARPPLDLAGASTTPTKLTASNSMFPSPAVHDASEIFSSAARSNRFAEGGIFNCILLGSRVHPTGPKTRRSTRTTPWSHPNPMPNSTSVEFGVPVLGGHRNSIGPDLSAASRSLLDGRFILWVVEFQHRTAQFRA